MKFTGSKVSVLLISTLVMAACSRTAEKTPLQDAQVTLGPAQKDTIVKMHPVSIEQRKNSLSYQGEIATKDLFHLSDNLLTLSEQHKSSEIEVISQRIMRTYYKVPTQKVSFSDSIFTQTILGQGEPEVRKQLTIISKEIQKATKGLSSLLENSSRKYPWPKKLGSFAEALETTDNYAVWFVNEIPKLGIDKDLTKPIQSAVKGEYSRFRPIVAKYMTDIQSAPRLSASIASLELALQEFAIELPGKDQKQIRKAKDLAKNIDSLDSSLDALKLLVQVWRMSSPEDRQKIFQAKVPELYDYMKDRSESELDCLAADVCLNPVIMVPKRLVILPKLTEYGIYKIRDEVDSAARQEIMKSALAAITDFLPTLPVFVKDKMLAEVNKYKKQIAAIERDFEGFAKTRIENWAASNFKTPLRGFESNRVQFSWKAGESFTVDNLQKPGKTIETGAEALGAQLAISQKFLPKEEDGKHAMRAALVEPIIKMLAITGFRKPGGSLFPSAMLALDGEPEQLFNVGHLLQGKTSFAVPNQFTASSSRLIMDRKKATKNSSVSAQAELLRGFSQQIAFHRDWEKNSFDEVLGSVRIEDVVPEVPRGAIDYSLFPKDIVFTLAVGGAGGILQNIIRDLSPAFLVLDKEEILWGNDYQKISDGKISTVAAMVDIVNGKRGNQVRTADVAKFILAVDAFLEATEGMENTNSPILREKGENGRSVLEEIDDARRYLRLFQMGLTNFLVYVAQNKDGSFASSFSLEKSLTKNSETILLADQVLAIRALNATAKRLNLPLFRWAALDGYYFLNRSMWDVKRQFYFSAYSPKGNSGLGAATPLEIIATLRGLEEFSEFLPVTSRQQWERIARPWIYALEEF